MFLANKLNKGAGSPAALDAQFNYVTMLLHGDGTNGAQNNTFLDSSTNNFTITRNGNTTQGSFSPYGSNWSNYFDGSSSLSLATATALGTGNVTVEFWFYPTDISATYRDLYEGRSSVNSNTGFAIFQYGQTIEIYGNGLKVSSAASAFTANAWTHFAVVRTSGTCQIYINGVASGSSGSYSDNFTSTVRKIGDAINSFPYIGYISNLREVTSALYSGTFTPSTTPLTAISGTTLLTCQSNRFIDNSTNAYAITINGTPSVQRFNPFGASTAYSTSVIGGSAYFDGTGDYLTAPSNSAFAMGTGDFTIECWINTPLVNANNDVIIELRSSGGTSTGFVFNMNPTGIGYQLNFYTDGGFNLGSTVLNYNVWNHCAVTRSGTTVRLFSNGVINATFTKANNFSDTPVPNIGFSPLYSPSNLLGYMTDLRVVKGTAVYTANFTPPTAPLTAITNTSLLLKYINGAIFDNAMMNDLETLGNAQISTSVKKYGTGSLAFDGTGDYLVSAPSPNNILGGGDFTLEFWLYPSNTSSAYRALVSSETYNPGTTGGWSLYQNGTSFELWIVPSNIITATSAITASVWQHVALCRASGTLRLFVNGTSVGSVSNTTSLTGQKILIGDNLGSYFYNGYLDDLRITKGYARYTATFTPPTAALPDTGPV